MKTLAFLSYLGKEGIKGTLNGIHLHKKIIKRRMVKYEHLLNDRAWFDFMNTSCLKEYNVSYMDECMKKSFSAPNFFNMAYFW